MVKTTATNLYTLSARNVHLVVPEVDSIITSVTNRIYGVHNELYGKHDEEQIRMMDEACIVLDEDDVPLGRASKKTCKRATTPCPAESLFTSTTCG